MPGQPRIASEGKCLWRVLFNLCLFILLLAGISCGLTASTAVKAQEGGGEVQFADGVEAEFWYRDHEIEHSWVPDYLDLATGDPTPSPEHGIYAWPYALDSIGWSMQSYQDYGGTPYFHHGMDMMKMWGTQVFNRSGGQVVNIENYQPGNYLYWEVAVLDPDGYLWQYHHVQMETIPQLIWDKYNEWLLDPVNGGFIPPDTHLGNIVEWPVWSYGKQFNHIHLNILAQGGVYVNGFEFHVPLPDADIPEIQEVGLLQNHQIYAGSTIDGPYSLYVRARDLILDEVYYLPPFEITFSVDGGPTHTTWRFDTLPGGDRYAFLEDFYVVPPTCGDYGCRDYYIDLGFIPNSLFQFPITGGEHVVQVTVSDYAGNIATQPYTYTVIGPPEGTLIWGDDLETSLGWVVNPDGTDTATRGLWERGDPQATSYNGPKQLGNAHSGINDLVTGRLDNLADLYDVDGGVTSVRSPDIYLPAAESLTISFRYYLAHSSDSSNSDFLRVEVVGDSTQLLLEELGAADNDNGAWEISNVSLDAFATQTVHLLITAADAIPESWVVEAAIDDVLVIGTGINQRPSADAQSISLGEDGSTSIQLSGSDPEGQPITFTVVTTPAHGLLGGIAPSLVYTPSLNFNGSDSFSFTVSDGAQNSAPGVVEISVTPANDLPEAFPQSLATYPQRVVAITLSGMDIDGDPLTFTVTVNPLHGTLSGTAPNLLYTPDPTYIGVDSFVFVANDGVLISPPAQVTITVNYAAYAPVVFK